MRSKICWRVEPESLISQSHFAPSTIRGTSAEACHEDHEKASTGHRGQARSESTRRHE
jgi:hypothetical protein